MSQLLLKPPSHDDRASSVEAAAVCVQYDGTLALEDINFTLSLGERMAVVGPNGAGKTTLLKVIAGTERPSSGSVKVYGHRPGGHICIAYLPQRSRVDWSFPVTVREVVMMGRIRKIGLLRWPRARDWQLVTEALVRVGMAEKAGRQLGELSGGQQQRVFLAQSLAQEAELILLDEPLTGLDLPSQTAIFSVLDDLREIGVPVVISTHDLNLASERFDRVMLLNRRIFALGPPSQALTHETLASTFGSHFHLVPEGNGALALVDSCCDEGEETQQ